MKPTTQQQKFRAKHQHEICRAILRGGLPDAAIEWPVLSVQIRMARFGSGESAKFGTSILARLDGKQLERQASLGGHVDAGLEHYNLTGTPVLFHKKDGLRLFVLKP